jgi:5-methyltetrahydrofolate--homocysteine methyltransferase
MATVKGDVHDIGKNIVGVVLGCNNYEVIDLGVMVPTDKILKSAIEEKVDVIGLSGLITPSLDEMVEVAKEMERLGLKIPLLIGGATTSKVHTAVKIAPAYSGAVVHVLDASRSVPVVSSLISQTLGDEFKEKIKGDYERIREEHKRRQDEKNFISISQARKNKFNIDWDKTSIVRPEKLGVTALNDFPLEELRKYIDWTPFFSTWELKGRYPEIFEKPEVGEEAKKLFDDANRLLDKVIKEKSIKANAVFGLFAANSVEDDIEVYSDESKKGLLTTLHTLFHRPPTALGSSIRAPPCRPGPASGPPTASPRTGWPGPAWPRPPPGDLWTRPRTSGRSARYCRRPLPLTLPAAPR